MIKTKRQIVSRATNFDCIYINTRSDEQKELQKIITYRQRFMPTSSLEFQGT